MLNATLILLALCLWLRWQLASTVHSAADAFAKGMTAIEPLTKNVEFLGSEVLALRGDIGAIQTSTLDAQSASMQLLQSQLNTQMEGLD